MRDSRILMKKTYYFKFRIILHNLKSIGACLVIELCLIRKIDNFVQNHFCQNQDICASMLLTYSARSNARIMFDNTSFDYFESYKENEV